MTIILIHVFACNKNESTASVNSFGNTSTNRPLFKLLQASQTHIDFQNTLTEGLNTNILLYEYFYNGGGVAAGDFNNDGLIDLYFTSNMSDNKLYLNKGGMQFEDITLISGAEGRPGPWKTGVTAVDINGDHLLDLYICYSGALPEDKRANQLFINQGSNERGIPKFKDLAEAYGLNSPAYSTQSYFFDYDRDGDLDMILLNHNPKNLPLLNEQSTAELFKKDDPFKGTRLFRQDRGLFKDVTQASGINGSALSYGLGIGISDLNQDRWPDFYVSNDYAVPDYLYINNKNGTFTNQLSSTIGHTSQFSMGNDIADINNDGFQDIFTLDMLPEDNHRQKLLLAPDNYNKFNLNVRSGFYYQYMRNMMQLNNGPADGGISFSEIGQLSGISNTDWSWSALFADYNDDGWKDLYVTNGYRRDYTNLDFINYMDGYVKEKGRLIREDVMGIIDHMPASNVTNYMFSNQDGLHFKNTTAAWGLNRSSNSNGAAYADLDNDGDLDLVVNNINEPAFVYQNEINASEDQTNHHTLNIRLTGEHQNTSAIGTKVTIAVQGTRQEIEQFPSRGYQSSVSSVLHFGLGTHSQIDSMIIQWPTGKQQIVRDIKADQLIKINEHDGNYVPQTLNNPPVIFNKIQSPIRLDHQSELSNDFDRQPLLINQLSYDGPCIISGDLNKDGLTDILFAGSTTMNPAIYFQQKNKSFTKSNQPDFEILPFKEGGAAAMLDINKDGFQDIYLGTGGYHRYTENDTNLQDRILINDQHGIFKLQADALPLMNCSKGTVVSIDMNDDDLPDLFVGSQCIPGRYPETPESYLLINESGNGKVTFTNKIKDLAQGLMNIGIVTDAISVDLNGDLKNDLVTVGQWMPVSVFINENGKLINKTNTFFDKEYKGWWNTIETADFNKDGHPDFVIGNLGLNTQLKASDPEPTELYFKDFDRNGSVDPILCTYIQGKSYPYVTRDELVKQLSIFRQRFTSFESYSTVTIGDLFDKSTLISASHLTANHFETSVFISDSQGHYRLISLPVQSQYAPVHAIKILDFDLDGKEDMLLCGNEHHFKIRIGQADANYGCLLKGKGDGSFHYIDQIHSGLKLTGDVRSIVSIDAQTLLFGINNQSSVVYKFLP